MMIRDSSTIEKMNENKPFHYECHRPFLSFITHLTGVKKLMKFNHICVI